MCAKGGAGGAVGSLADIVFNRRLPSRADQIGSAYVLQ